MGCGGVGASACGTQTSGLVGGCQPGANSGCSGAATGCGPPSEGGGSVPGASSVSSGRISNGFGSALVEDDFDGVLRSEEWPQASVDINVDVSSSTLSVGDKTDLILTVKALKDYPNAIIELLLPSGVKRISGDLNWAGSLFNGEEKNLTATVQIVQDGVLEIYGKMIASEGEVDRIGKMDKLVLSVGEDALQQYNSTMKAFTDPEQSVIRIADSVATEAFVGPASPGTVTIYGYFGLYECRCDPTDDNNCPCPTCTGNNCVSNGGAAHYHGMPYMYVEAWDDDTGIDDLIATTYTDVNGYYYFDNIDNADLDEGGTNEWYVKFILLGWPWFQTGGGDGYTWVQSLDLAKSWQNAYYATWSIGILPDGTVRNVGTILLTDSRKTNILYAVMKECYWMYYHCYGWDMPNVCVFYPGTTSATDVDDYEIEIAGPGKSAYDHAMDDDVVEHEYGHDVMYYYYQAWPRRSTQVTPAGVCSIAVEGCSGGCTVCVNHGGSYNNCSCDGISEGWANFVAALVPEEWNSRNWATDRYVVSKDGLVYRDHESNAVVHEYDEMTFARILWDILDPIADGETAEVLFEKGTLASDYDHNPIWWEMTRQNPVNEHSLQEEPYTLVEFWIFWLETFPWGDTTVGEPQLCNIYSLHGVTRDFTNRCSAACYGYCNGACAFCVPNCADDPCGGAGCPGVGCVSADCSVGWCDSAQPGQGCNLAWPSQCTCYSYGVNPCSNANPSTTCHSTCLYIRSCGYTPCGGAGCPGVSCLDCTAGWCDSAQPGQGCNGVYPSQCNCYGHGVPSICSNADPSTVCVSGCWNNPCACGGAGCPGTGCYTCTTGWCDSAQPGQGCNGVYPSQCACWSHGVPLICSNADPATTCVSGCWVNPCACGGVGCPGTGCYTCTGTVIDWCDCGGDTCICGGENDCTAYAVNNFMPCGGTVPDPCVCGGVGCACIAGAPDCAANPTVDRPCGGTVVDTCGCGGVGCNCGSENDCAAFAVNNFMPCGGVTSCVCGGVGCACPVYCYLAPPPPGGWILLATDPDEGVGTSLKEIRGQRYSGVIYFKVEHYRPWATITNIDTGILIDADQNPSTGLPDGTYPYQTTGIGADYMILVGWEATVMFKWVGSWWDLANPISFAYLDAPNGATVFVVGVYLADVATVGALDCAVFDVVSNWDWMPNTGHFTLELPAWRPCGGTVVDTCDCGGVDCNCGSENDCAAFAVNNFMPCGGVTPCVCGGVGCACPDYCSLQPPLPGGWILLATDPDEGVGSNLAEIYGQRYSGVIYFRVHYYRPWATITDIDTGIFVDSDQNPSTGMPDGYYPGQTTGIGADYLIIVGMEGPVMWRWVGSSWDTAHPIALAYLDAPNGATVFVAGVFLADVVTVGALDCAVTDVPSNWDWMPDTGYFTLPLAWTPCSGTVVDTCDCGIPLCACGFENDCASYAVNNFWPCEISAAHDVAVIAVTPSKTIVGQGYSMTIAVTVENHGTYPETFTVTAFANGIYIGSQTITLPGGSTVVTIPWDTATFAKIDYTISAVADIVPCEIHIADNTFINGIVMVRTPGDLNADGIVNILDAAAVSAHWYPGPPIGPLGYDPNYDINNDGMINVLDMAIVSAYWTGPPKGPLDP